MVVIKKRHEDRHVTIQIVEPKYNLKIYHEEGGPKFPNDRRDRKPIDKSPNPYDGYEDDDD